MSIAVPGNSLSDSASVVPREKNIESLSTASQTLFRGLNLYEERIMCHIHDMDARNPQILQNMLHNGAKPSTIIETFIAMLNPNLSDIYSILWTDIHYCRSYLESEHEDMLEPFLRLRQQVDCPVPHTDTLQKAISVLGAENVCISHIYYIQDTFGNCLDFEGIADFFGEVSSEIVWHTIVSTLFSVAGNSNQKKKEEFNFFSIPERHFAGLYQYSLSLKQRYFFHVFPHAHPDKCISLIKNYQNIYDLSHMLEDIVNEHNVSINILCQFLEKSANIEYTKELLSKLGNSTVKDLPGDVSFLCAPDRSDAEKFLYYCQKHDISQRKFPHAEQALQFFNMLFQFLDRMNMEELGEFMDLKDTTGYITNLYVLSISMSYEQILQIPDKTPQGIIRMLSNTTQKPSCPPTMTHKQGKIVENETLKDETIVGYILSLFPAFDTEMFEAYIPLFSYDDVYSYILQSKSIYSMSMSQLLTDLSMKEFGCDVQPYFQEGFSDTIFSREGVRHLSRETQKSIYKTRQDCLLVAMNLAKSTLDENENISFQEFLQTVFSPNLCWVFTFREIQEMLLVAQEYYERFQEVRTYIQKYTGSVHQLLSMSVPENIAYKEFIGNVHVEQNGPAMTFYLSCETDYSKISNIPLSLGCKFNIGKIPALTESIVCINVKKSLSELDSTQIHETQHVVNSIFGVRSRLKDEIIAQISNKDITSEHLVCELINEQGCYNYYKHLQGTPQYEYKWKKHVRDTMRLVSIAFKVKEKYPDTYLDILAFRWRESMVA